MTAAGLDPITVEVIGSAFSSIVEEMGTALIRASYSTNIKGRRLDDPVGWPGADAGAGRAYSNPSGVAAGDCG